MDSWFNMWSNREIVMEVVVIGMDKYAKEVVEKLRRRGIRVFIVPGKEVVVYRFNSGFQELDGGDAVRYLLSLLDYH